MQSADESSSSCCQHNTLASCCWCESEREAQSFRLSPKSCRHTDIQIKADGQGSLSTSQAMGNDFESQVQTVSKQAPPPSSAQYGLYGRTRIDTPLYPTGTSARSSALESRLVSDQNGPWHCVGKKATQPFSPTCASLPLSLGVAVGVEGYRIPDILPCGRRVISINNLLIECTGVVESVRGLR